MNSKTLRRERWRERRKKNKRGGMDGWMDGTDSRARPHFVYGVKLWGLGRYRQASPWQQQRHCQNHKLMSSSCAVCQWLLIILSSRYPAEDVCVCVCVCVCICWMMEVFTTRIWEACWCSTQRGTGFRAEDTPTCSPEDFVVISVKKITVRTIYFPYTCKRDAGIRPQSPEQCKNVALTL